jgi:hypothetical protein
MLLALAFALTPHLAPLPAPDPGDLRWGRIGHRTMARLAASQISPRARTEVRRLLGDVSLAEASIWADEVREARPETSPWHYVNIPISDSGYRPEVHCPTACVVSAAEAQLAILRDRRQSDERRAEALKFVIHFIGDLHMPLHAGDRGDRGGNGVTVWYQWRRTNLHALWDSRMIEARIAGEDQLVSALERRAREHDNLASVRAGTITSWTMESHRLARDLVYPRLSPWLFITDRYVDEAMPVIEERLFQAGVRLAGVLNQVFD